MRPRLPAAWLVAAATVVVTRGGARAESPTRDTVDGIKALAAPVSRLELRVDASYLTTGRLDPITNRRDDSRAAFDVELQTKPSYWYRLGAVAILRKTVAMPTADTMTTEATDQIVFSARFFKRIGPLVLSAGIVDNGAGAGFELRALDDRLRVEVLGTDASLTDPRAAPRLRVGGSAQWRFLYVAAVTLDAFGDAWGTTYFGGGLRWRDEDLLGTAFWLGR